MSQEVAVSRRAQQGVALSKDNGGLRCGSLHLSTFQVTFAAIGFCSLNTAGCVSGSAELSVMILLPVDMVGFYLNEVHRPGKALAMES